MKSDKERSILYSWMMVQHREISTLWKILEGQDREKDEIGFPSGGKVFDVDFKLPTSDLQVSPCDVSAIARQSV